VAPHWPRGAHGAVTAQALGQAAREPVDSRLRSSPGHCPLRRQRRCSGVPRETSNRFGPRSRQAGSIPVRLRYEIARCPSAFATKMAASPSGLNRGRGPG
jgi:hypothetical protein